MPHDSKSPAPKIVVYTTPTCPFCISAKNLLNQKGYPFEEIDVSDPTARESLLKKANGRRTVPQIFIGALHVGGFDDLSALNLSGELDRLMGA